MSSRRSQEARNEPRRPELISRIFLCLPVAPRWFKQFSGGCRWPNGPGSRQEHQNEPQARPKRGLCQHYASLAAAFF